MIEFNDQIITAGDDRAVKVWNLRSGKNFMQNLGHTKGVLCLEHVTSSVYCSGSADHVIRFWKMDKVREIGCLKGHMDDVNDIVRVSNNHILSCSNDETVKVSWTKFDDFSFFSLTCNCLVLGH